ncbi:hypothetical protein KCV07_g3761, partial [Aureobasidium melanogenum]
MATNDRHKYLAEDMRCVIKNTKYRTQVGFLLEREIFRKLELAGVPFVPGAEFAQVDGALIVPGSSNEPPPGYQSYETWKWAMEQTDVSYIPFDIKTVSLAAIAKGNLDYSYSWGVMNTTYAAEIYLVAFETIPDYIAIMPKVIWETCMDAVEGTNALIARLQCMAQPFMVHDDDIKQAFINLVDCKEDLVNPTTGVTFHGYRAKSTSQLARISLDSEASRNPQFVNSFVSLKRLWNAIEQLDNGTKVEFNFLPPHICDFVLYVPGIEKAIRIEHKEYSGRKVWDPPEAHGYQNPFSPDRMWHFLIVQDGKEESLTGLICIGRHEVKPGIIARPRFFSKKENYLPFYFTGPDAVGQVIKSIWEKAPHAMKFADDTLRDLCPDDIDIDSVITTNKVLDVMEGFRQWEADNEKIRHEDGAFEDENQTDEWEDVPKEEPQDHDPEDREPKDGQPQDVEPHGGLPEHEEQLDQRSQTSELLNPGQPATGLSKKRKVLSRRSKYTGGRFPVQVHKHFRITRNGRVFNREAGRWLPRDGLHWMCDALNEQCRTHGSMMCYPLDIGHAYGNHILVDHHWTDAEKKMFDLKRLLPADLFGSKLRGKKSIVLRMVDFTPGTKNDSFPLCIKPRHWIQPAAGQHFIWIAGTTVAGLVTKASPYLLYPSNFTTLFDDEKCAGPFVHRGQSYIQNHHSIYKHLRQAMEGDEMSIQNDQSSSRGVAFDPRVLHTTTTKVLQAYWDYGVRRMPLRVETVVKRFKAAGATIEISDDEGALAERLSDNDDNDHEEGKGEVQDDGSDVTKVLEDEERQSQ